MVCLLVSFVGDPGLLIGGRLCDDVLVSGLFFDLCEAQVMLKMLIRLM